MAQNQDTSGVRIMLGDSEQPNTVAALIEALQQCPPEATVWAGDGMPYVVTMVAVDLIGSHQMVQLS